MMSDDYVRWGIEELKIEVFASDTSQLGGYRLITPNYSYDLAIIQQHGLSITVLSLCCKDWISIASTDEAKGPKCGTCGELYPIYFPSTWIDNFTSLTLEELLANFLSFTELSSGEINTVAQALSQRLLALGQILDFQTLSDTFEPALLAPLLKPVLA